MKKFIAIGLIVVFAFGSAFGQPSGRGDTDVGKALSANSSSIGLFIY